MITSSASQCSTGPQSLVQIIMSNQNMTTQPNMVTDNLVSPLAPMNILEPSSFNLTQNLNEVLPMNPMFPNTRNTTMPIPENSIQGFGTQPLAITASSPSPTEPFFFYSDDIKLYQDPLTVHSRGCLFNPTVNLRPQYVVLPPGTNEAVYFQWFIGEGKGNFRDAVPQLLLSLPLVRVEKQSSYGICPFGSNPIGQEIQETLPGAPQTFPLLTHLQSSNFGELLVNLPLPPVVEQNPLGMYQFGKNPRASLDSKLLDDVGKTWYPTFPSTTYLNLDMNNSSSSSSSCSSSSCGLRPERFEAPAMVASPEPPRTQTPQEPTNQSPEFKEAVAHCKSVKHYKHPSLKHSLDCLFNPTNPRIPQTARYPVGNNRALFLEWYQGEKKGAYLEGAAEWKTMKKKEKQDWSDLSKYLRTEYDNQLKKGFIRNNATDS
ncbi:unnamed protein product [Caenorhabditis nigoni]